MKKSYECFKASSGLKSTTFFTQRLLAFSTFLFMTATLFAQTPEQRKEIIKNSNIPALDQLKASAQQATAAQKRAALQTASQKGWQTRITEADGTFSELQSVITDKKGIQYPLYYTTYNVDAAESTRADHLNSGGSLGLNLDGQGLTANVWDGGHARVTHREYDGAGGNNRVSIIDTDAEGGTQLNFHAGHVTGTITASGVTARAKGMAPQSKVRGFMWNDDLAEATDEAANGMIVSNHSYGFRSDAVPDQFFGAYITYSRDWDELMFNAPYYLMVVAAGNDGNNNSANAEPLDGNRSYDKLTAYATCKNNLVVANANDANIASDGSLNSVSINGSSSEGPTDDYRIKPDIAGNGTSVYSTYTSSDSAYNSITGTSMASPNVAGTLLLLQQHHSNLNGGLMRSASLKGLALHTADDAGLSGPDAVFGWGLMNAKKAAETLSKTSTGESKFDELTLRSGETYTITVDSDGSSPLMASISWTDRAGVATEETNSNNPVLVNDLDIRVSQGSTTYEPYRLTGVNSNGRGDNRVDPFERIDVANASGTYTITVTHKGSLTGGNQDYTLIVTGISEPVVCVADQPSGLGASNVSSSEATLNWGNVPAALFDVRYRAAGTSSWTTITDIAGTSTVLTGLSALTSYEAQVRSTCDDGSNSSYTNTVSFTTADFCNGRVDAFPYSESFEGSLGAWTQSSSDDIDWTINSGGTPSNNTGPSGASAGNSYIYVEASGEGENFPNKVASLVSPCFDFTGTSDLALGFDYHMYGSAVNSLTVEAKDGNTGAWATVFSQTGDQGNSWNTAAVDMSAYEGASAVQLRITVVTGNGSDGWQSDIAIDAITIEEGSTPPPPPPGDDCSSTVASFPYGQSFEGNIGDWTQDSNDDIDWDVNSGGTPSSSTGPSSASDGSSYVYVEASGEGTGFPNKVAILNSPCYDFSGASDLTFGFDYHMYGSAVNSLTAEARVDNAGAWSTIFSETGDQGNTWNTAAVDLSAYAGESSVQFRFTVVTGSGSSGWQSDIAIDAVTIQEGPSGPGPDTQAPSAPVNVEASNITQTTATISWDASSDNVGVTGYDVYEGTSLVSTVSGTALDVSGLSAATTYTYSVVAKDAAGNESTAGNVTFTTADEPVSGEYCDSNGNSTSAEWIDRVTLEQIDNRTRGNGGYGDFTSQSATLARGGSYDLIVSAGFRWFYSATQHWAVWVDLNQDGVFSDAEKLEEGSSSSSGNLNGSLTIPSSAALGSTRMRVSMKKGSAQTACESFASGEVEDYTINIVGSTLTSFGDVVATTGTLTEEVIKDIKITPNPASSTVRLGLTGFDISNANYRIINTIGQTVLNGKADSTIDVSNLNSGIYIIEVNDGIETSTSKLIKE